MPGGDSKPPHLMFTLCRVHAGHGPPQPGHKPFLAHLQADSQGGLFSDFW